MRIPFIEKYKNKIGFYFNSPLRKGSKKDFVFIHIPKTAGTSITKIIGEPFQKHNTAKVVIDTIGRKQWENAYKFSVVRNPWDKVHSWYKFRVMHDQSKMKSRPISFKDWVACTYGEPKDPYYYYRAREFMPQVEWWKNENDVIEMDRIIRFENLAEEFNEVANIVGIESKLPHINKTESTNYRDHYDEETKKIIEDWFREDIEMFGYKF
jgi:hypothetical protein